MEFKDHFSGHAQSYAAARPGYPSELFDFLQSECSERNFAWDCATGNGQAAVGLAPYFKNVLATDASSEQIEQTQSQENIQYRVMPAEYPELDDASVDLVTVAQAIHWFDIEKFFSGVERVLKVNGLLAVWSYGLHKISPECDAITEKLYSEIVGKYWPPERASVEKGYDEIHFPFAALNSPSFEIRCHWTCAEVLGYYNSWSAVQRYMAENETSPLELIKSDLINAWGDVEQREVNWPISLYVSRKLA